MELSSNGVLKACTVGTSTTLECSEPGVPCTAMSLWPLSLSATWSICWRPDRQAAAAKVPAALQVRSSEGYRARR